MNKKTIRDIDLQNKTVILRVDFNVPIENGEVVDDLRIREALPTIRYLLSQNAKIYLLAHLGRPEGKPKESLKMAPVARRLSFLLGLSDSPDKKIYEERVINLGNLKIPTYEISPDLILLENIRFYPQEEKNDLDFAQKLASLGEIYINDAFGTVHRAHASIEGITHFVKHKVAGFLVEKELGILNKILENPLKPFVVIMGGAKVYDKLGLIRKLTEKADYILTGGGIANTFLKAKGKNLENSLVDERSIDVVLRLLTETQKIKLPLDVLVADKKEKGAKTQILEINNDFKMPKNWQILDIGPKTVEGYCQIINQAKTIFWNGPVGYTDIEDFSFGSRRIAECIIKREALSVVGGGDTTTFLEKNNLIKGFSHISTGGGVTLQFLAGEKLPGIEVLDEKEGNRVF